MLVISTVNCDWHSFNPSPFSTRYLNGEELRSILTAHGFDAKIFCAFPDRPSGILSRAIRVIRLVAIRLGLIPKSMKGKEWLKRLAYGKLKVMSREISDQGVISLPLVPIDEITDLANYRNLYAVARAPEVPAAAEEREGSGRRERGPNFESTAD